MLLLLLSALYHDETKNVFYLIFLQVINNKNKKTTDTIWQL